MQPKDFKERNLVYGENQPEYIPLPAHRQPDGTVTMCIELSEEDKKKVMETGVIWAQLLTFNQPIQPLNFFAEKPDMPRNEQLEKQLAELKKQQAELKKKKEEAEKNLDQAKEENKEEPKTIKMEPKK